MNEVKYYLDEEGLRSLWNKLNLRDQELVAKILKISNQGGTMTSKLKIIFPTDCKGQTYTISGGANEKYSGSVPENLIVEQAVKELNNSYTVYCTSTFGNTYLQIIPTSNYYGIYEYEIQSSLKIVSWLNGTDEEVGALLDAAKAGVINLQTDAGWHIGDIRNIQIGSFVDGSSTTHSAQSIDIAISSFENYNNSGSIMQFDFKDCLATASRVNPSPTNIGGYGSTEMYKVTLPNLVNALPDWLKTRLLEFPVLVSAGNQSSTIETITGNKLALRSEIELFGTTTNSIVGEGSWIEYYKITGNRLKNRGHNGSGSWWWERSPSKVDNVSFCLVNTRNEASYGQASGAIGVAPFGCI